MNLARKEYLRKLNRAYAHLPTSTSIHFLHLYTRRYCIINSPRSLFQSYFYEENIRTFFPVIYRYTIHSHTSSINKTTIVSPKSQATHLKTYDNILLPTLVYMPNYVPTKCTYHPCTPLLYCACKIRRACSAHVTRSYTATTALCTRTPAAATHTYTRYTPSWLPPLYILPRFQRRRKPPRLFACVRI